MKFQPILLAAAAAVLTFYSCKKHQFSETKSTGYVSLDVSMKIDAVPLAKSTNSSNFSINIYSVNDELIKSYENYNEMPDKIELPEGDYYAVVHGKNYSEAAFENPVYGGQSEVFTVTEGSTSYVTITAELSNLAVSIEYSSNIVNYFTAYQTVVTTSGGSLTFDETETRKGYFDVKPLLIEATLQYNKGGITDSKTLSKTIANPTAKTHYRVQINALPDSVLASFSITLDSSMTEEVVVLSETPMVDIIFTEMMPNPSAIGDSKGEWLELYNRGDKLVNLNGYTLTRSSGSKSHTINEDVLINSGQYIVMANYDTAISNIAYVYSGLSMGNGGDDWVLLSPENDTICEFEYTSSYNGASMQLSSASMGGDAYKNTANWCQSGDIYGEGDSGTPGLANNSCP